MRNKRKIVNDPIYGFISIPSELVFDIMEHPYFQRLRRISQMGMSYLVYPGAHHTRFHHALGAMFLMQRAVYVLRTKDINISSEEEEALYIAILLHDIGHGPFSHALENSIIENLTHETISLAFMEALNDEFEGKLSLAIQIFRNEHPRAFFHQLIASQLDVDRLDYLRRDSFYSGVQEGTINSQRIIAMLNVHNDTLVVEEKGIYSIEKFIIARRLMYWQVYLHKTGLAAEQLLLRMLKRAKELVSEGVEVPASEALSFFLSNSNQPFDLKGTVLNTFAKLDDYDIVSAMKQWTDHSDFVLRSLSSMLLNRNLLKIKLKKRPPSPEKMKKKLKKVMDGYKLSEKEARYFVFSGTIENQAYNMDKNPICLLTRNGKIKDVAKASDQVNLMALAEKVTKYYVCYPKRGSIEQ
ncbi:HD domain-containing protein [Luteirhabdus pelagi]|uniref:HD domain-containing protein n=1 Tax=Luteirhabdus pelagi TaxID=2792783 RepID=UPI00293D8166|nr:HD domain-containing protein [Luteirhabdus pelagi]